MKKGDVEFVDRDGNHIVTIHDVDPSSLLRANERAFIKAQASERGGFASGPQASSETAEWGTPRQLFAEMSHRFGPFDLDVCATPENAKCARYFTKAEDGLAQEWAGRCWMNPPYGKQIGQWMRKAWESAQQGATVVCLVPARTGATWWHDWAMRGEIIYLRGRIRFNGPKGGPAPFASAIVVFHPRGQ